MVKFNKVVLSQKLFNALEKWSSSCILRDTRTRVHENCLRVHETYDVLKSFGVHEIKLETYTCYSWISDQEQKKIS